MSEQGPPPEPVISSELIYSGHIVSLKVDRVQTSSGAVVLREVVEHRGSVTIVPLRPGGKVVMIRQYRHPAGKVLWELPSGTLEKGEDPETCARRELAEEVGYEAANWQPLFSAYLTPGYCTELAYLYLATDLTPVERAPEGDEEIATQEIPLAEAVAMVLRGEVQNANAVMGLLAAQCRMQAEDTGGRAAGDGLMGKPRSGRGV